MTAPVTSAPPQISTVQPGQAGFVRDGAAVAGRGLRAIPRDIEAVVPPVFIAGFLFIVNVGTLKRPTETNIAGFDFATFMMATAVLLGAALGVRFETGITGVAVYILARRALEPGLRRLRLRHRPEDRQPRRVNTSFLLFFPFLFLTSSYVPRSQLSGWLDTVAAANPVTYLLDGLRSLTTGGWQPAELGQALIAIAVLGLISMTLCLAAL